MKFNVGQKVVFLHEKGGGIVKSVTDKGRYIVEDEDGFDREFKASELAQVYSEEYKIDDDLIQGINADETFSIADYQVSRGSLSRSGKQVDVWEIDLHIEELTDSHAGWSNTEIVRKQMLELNSFFKKAQANRIRKIIVIHGVGTGVLKEEVRSFLRNQEVVEIYDADYREYGKGATVAELPYNT